MGTESSNVEAGCIHPAEHDAMPFEEVVSGLRSIVGAKLTAYIGSASHTRTVRGWVTGDSPPVPYIARRLAVAHRIAEDLHTREGAATIQSWFQGMNPDLDDLSPAELLRDGSFEDIDNVKAAANNFMVYG